MMKNIKIIFDDLEYYPGKQLNFWNILLKPLGKVASIYIHSICLFVIIYKDTSPDSYVYGANMGPSGPTGPRWANVGPMNFVIWVDFCHYGLGAWWDNQVIGETPMP